MNRVQPQADPEFNTAKEVADFLLDVTRKMILSGDTDGFLSRCRLPQTIGTFEGTRILTKPAELREIFENVGQHLAAIGALDMQRKTIAARFIDPDQVQSTFSSQYVLPGLQLTPETVAHGRLVRTQGIWQIAEHHYATVNPSFERALAAKPLRHA